MSNCSNTKRTINFKHVGFKRTDRRFEIQTVAPSIPIGIKTPLALSTGKSNLFDMHYNPEDQIQDNLKNLILTDHGERLGRDDFGANLGSLTFDLSSMKDYEMQVAVQIRNAVDKFMPIVELDDIAVDVTNHKFAQAELPDTLAQITVTISYNVPRLRIVGKKFQTIIYAGG